MVRGDAKVSCLGLYSSVEWLWKIERPEGHFNHGDSLADVLLKGRVEWLHEHANVRITRAQIVLLELDLLVGLSLAYLLRLL